MQGRYGEFRALGAQVLVVTRARPDFLSMFLRAQPLPFPAVADPERLAYRAFGLERASWGQMLRPRALLGYFRLMVRGWCPRPARGGEDVLQLGGDFVLDDEERLVYAYRSADPADRPSVDVLLQAVRQAQRAS